MSKEHGNLFYILKKDHEEHPMPPHFLEQLRKMLSDLFGTEKEKTKNISKK